jgi:hypothetical protein
MGKKSSKSTTGPSKFAQPYIRAGADALNSVYQKAQPQLDTLTDTFSSSLPDIIKNTMQNPNLAAAGGYNADVLGGKFLGEGNPYLERMIGRTADDVQNRVNGSIGARGGAGGSAHSQILTRELADAENNLRYADYGTERGRMDSAVGQAAGLSSAGNQGIATLLASLQSGADLPYTGVDHYAGGLAGLLGNSTTTKQSQPWGPALLQGIGSAAGAFAASDRRLKRDVVKLREEPDGLGIYSYRYIWSPQEYVGAMADEVAELRPWAIGPEIAGYASVDYGRL